MALGWSAVDCTKRPLWHYAAYYFKTDDDVCISPSIFELLAERAPTGTDWPALAVYLRIGVFVGERWIFK
jgi:hypothetical protein